MTSRATESLLVDNTAQPVLPTAPAAIVRISMPCSPSMAANRASAPGSFLRRTVNNFAIGPVEPRRVLLCLTRVQSDAQNVADVVDRQHGQEDQHTWKNGPVRAQVKEILRVVKQASPGRHVWREAHTQE